MSEILYFILPKNTFRLFGTETMITQTLQYKIHMLEMLSLGFTIDEDIIKEDQNEVPQVGTNILFINAWNVEGAFMRPNDMTKKS